MKSIKELKNICIKKQYFSKDGSFAYKKYPAHTYAFYVTYFFSLRIVRLLLNTKITSNQITLFSTILGILSGIVFASGGRWEMLIGAILLESYYIMDCVDGQLARVKNISSMSGAYFDFFGNFIVPPCVFMGISFGIYKTFGCSWIFLLGYLAAFAITMQSIIDITMKEILLNRIIKISLEKNNSVMIKVPQPDPENKKPSLKKKIFSVLHRSCTYPIIMNVISIAAVVNILQKESRIFLYILMYFAVVGTFIWVIRLVRYVTMEKIEKEYKRLVVNA